MAVDLSIFRYIILIGVVVITSFCAAYFRGETFYTSTFIASMALGIMFLIRLGTLPGYLLLLVAILLGILFFTESTDENVEVIA